MWGANVAANRFIKRKIGRLTLWLDPQFADSPLQNTLADGLQSLAKAYSLDKVPASKSAEVYKFTYSANPSEPVFYFKQYHQRSGWDFIKHVFRAGRAERTVKAAAMLEANGFAVPEIVAMGCRRKGIFCLDNFLLTREVGNTLPLYAFFNQQYSKSSSATGRHGRMNLEKYEFIKALGRFVGRLHAKNISHGDLRLGNVLVRLSLDRPPATSNQQQVFKFFLLDNERTIQYWRLPNRLRLKNLVQCNMHQSAALTRTDRLRFFKAYLSENPSLVPAWKVWAKIIHRKTRRRLLKRI